MSFKKDEFVSYLKDKGLKSGRAYCSYLRKTEREFKTDIDAEFCDDECTALCEKLDARLKEYKVTPKSKNGRRIKVSSAKKKKYNALRQMRNAFKKYIDFCSGSKAYDNNIKKEDKLSLVDWSAKDTMVGTVRDGRQLEFILKYKGYYVPAYFITEDRLPIGYIALHEQGIGSEPGIRRYGEVLTAQKIKRGRIPVPMSRGNGDELYYYFQVRRWDKLSQPISIRDTSRGKPLFTNKFLLDNCTQSYQLFSVSSCEDFCLMTAINKAFDDLKNSKNDNYCAVYPIDKTYTLTLSEGCFSLVNDKGETLEKISVGSFSYRPRDSFNKFKMIIGNPV